MIMHVRVVQDRANRDWCHVDGCQNYGPFLHPYYNTASKVPKRDHNFDNNPCICTGQP